MDQCPSYNFQSCGLFNVLFGTLRQAAICNPRMKYHLILTSNVKVSRFQDTFSMPVFFLEN